jgi:hypothetical protein
MFQVEGPGGIWHLPVHDKYGRYRIDGILQVAENRAAIKEMTAMLHALIKSLGQAKMAFLAPLLRYWLKP